MQPTPLLELTAILSMLDAANHRNKNQHRLAKWWKEFSMLRRQLAKLIGELQILVSHEKTLGEIKKTIMAREVVTRRVDFMMQRIMPKCYLAFSAVVADNQYATLGLMLLGTSARIRTIVKPLGPKKDEVEDEVAEDSVVALESSGGPDLGEVVSRNNLQSREKPKENRSVNEKEPSVHEESNSQIATRVDGGGLPDLSNRSSTPVKRPKKKKKKGDAFDDLFAGLI